MFSSRAFRKEHSPTDTLILAQQDPRQIVRNYEIINKESLSH